MLFHGPETSPEVFDQGYKLFHNINGQGCFCYDHLRFRTYDKIDKNRDYFMESVGIYGFWPHELKQTNEALASMFYGIKEWVNEKCKVKALSIIRSNPSC